MHALRCLFGLTMLLAVPALAAGADLADGRTGKIQFESSTPTEELAVLTGRLGPRVTVEGILTLPTGSPPPYSVVVIAHGSGGVRQDREPRWAEELAKAGIASFIVDSYGPRKVGGTDTGDINLSTMANIADVFAALRLLSTHPLLDKGKIAIMGYSRGGHVALWTAFEPVRRAFLGESRLSFAAHVLIYPACNLQRVSAHMSIAPMLHLHGESDDLTPLGDCREYLDRLRASRGGYELERGRHATQECLLRRSFPRDGGAHGLPWSSGTKPPRQCRRLQRDSRRGACESPRDPVACRERGPERGPS